MPIEGRTLEEAISEFREHLNRVLALTVTPTPLVLIRVSGAVPPRMQLAFRRSGRPIEVALSTRFGRAGLYLGQTCESTQTEGRHQLRTVSYRYTVSFNGSREPLFRWEYRKDPGPSARYCRHHLQGAIPLAISEEAVSLNDLHLPTGFVTIEEVLRFCIVDLGVTPLSANWHEILTDSYSLFKSKFAPRG